MDDTDLLDTIDEALDANAEAIYDEMGDESQEQAVAELKEAALEWLLVNNPEGRDAVLAAESDGSFDLTGHIRDWFGTFATGFDSGEGE